LLLCRIISGIQNSGIPVPATYIDAVQNVINTDLHTLFQQNPINLNLLTRLAFEVQKWQVQINDKDELNHQAGAAILHALERLNDSEFNLKELKKLNAVFEILQALELSPNIWKGQNLYFAMMKGFKQGNWVFSNEEWQQEVHKLGNFLRVRVTEPEVVHS